MRILLCIGLIICISFGKVSAQSPSIKASTAYYLDLNSNSKVVYDLVNESLNIQYRDIYGKSSTATLILKDSHQKEVARFSLDKSFGLNHFKINLDKIYASWTPNAIYTCQLHDEASNKHELFLRRIDPEVKELELSIFVNPLALECDAITGNVVEFYGIIKEGKAPYVVSWYVLNENQSSFLLQPRQEIVERPGQTMVITVDKNPSYYVMLLVTDACGNEQKQMVYLQCDQDKKKINSLFVEPLIQINKMKTIN